MGSWKSWVRNGMAASKPDGRVAAAHLQERTPTRNGPVVSVAMAWLASPSLSTALRPFSISSGRVRLANRKPSFEPGFEPCEHSPHAFGYFLVSSRWSRS